MLRYIILLSIVFTLTSCKTITQGMVDGMSSISKGILSLDENNFSNFHAGPAPRIKKIVYTPMKINPKTQKLEPAYLGIKKIGFEKQAYLMPLREETFEYNDRGKLAKQIVKIPSRNFQGNQYSESQPEEVFLINDLVRTFSYDEEAQIVSVNEQTNTKIHTFIYKYRNRMPIKLYEVVNGHQNLIEEYDYTETKQLKTIKNSKHLIELDYGMRGRAEITKVNLTNNQKLKISAGRIEAETIGATLNYAGGTQNYSETYPNGDNRDITLKYSVVNREHLAPVFNLEESPSGKYAFRQQQGKTVYFLQKTGNESSFYDAYTAEFFYEKAAGNAGDFNPPRTDDELLGFINIF